MRQIICFKTQIISIRKGHWKVCVLDMSMPMSVSKILISWIKVGYTINSKFITECLMLRQTTVRLLVLFCLSYYFSWYSDIDSQARVLGHYYFKFRSVVSENVVAVKWAWWTFLGLRFGRLHDSTLVVALAVANLFMALLQL